MPLCKRHCTRVKPTVDNFRNSVHFFTAFRTLNSYSVNKRSVKFDFIRTVIRHWLKFFDRTDCVSVTAFTFPNIKRSTPITVTAYTPILYVFKPSTETSFTDCLRNPINCIVIFNKVVLNVCHLDKPSITCIVDKRCITSPTERIAVFKLRRIEQLTSFFKIYKNFFINIFTECTCPRCFLSHFTLTVNKLYERQVVLSADIRVVLTECRSDMNDTCTVCKSYITVASYIISLFIRCYEIE